MASDYVMMMVLVAGAFALYRLARGDRPGHAAADAAAENWLAAPTTGRLGRPALLLSTSTDEATSA
jgi:hypothetical protein